MRDQSGRVPLHFACKDRLVEPEHVVASLLVAYPKGAALADFDGTFAIHVAAEYSTTAVLDMVFKANEAALTKITTGWSHESVMHFAVSGQKLANIECLHALDPSLMAVRGNKGRTTLHMATSAICWNNFNFAAFNFVFACDPSAASVADNDGLLALHIIAYYLSGPLSDEVKCLRLLLKAYPQGASHLDNDGETPYLICKNHDGPAYARRLLLMAAPSLDPALLRKYNYEARRHVLFLAFAAVSPPSPPPAPPRPNLLRRIHKSQGGPDLTRKIATFL